MHTWSLVTLDRFPLRLLGLMGKQAIDPCHVFHLVPCNSVHTFGMRFALSVIFLDDQLRVLRMIDALAPCRVAWHWRARSVLELKAGTIPASQAQNLLAALFTGFTPDRRQC